MIARPIGRIADRFQLMVPSHLCGPHIWEHRPQLLATVTDKYPTAPLNTSCHDAPGSEIRQRETAQIDLKSRLGKTIANSANDIRFQRPVTSRAFGRYPSLPLQNGNDTALRKRSTCCLFQLG